MAKARINQVAEELLKQARAEKITWEPVEDNKTAYRASFPDTSLIVSKWSPLRNAPWATARDLSNSFNVDLATYRLDLLNESGEVVESLLTLPGQAVYRGLKEVYEMAHRKASYTEESIDKVLQHLQQT